MIQLALDVEKELRTNIIQAVEKAEGVYGRLLQWPIENIIIVLFFAELRISKDTTRIDNVPFNPNAIVINKTRKRRSNPVGCDQHTRPAVPRPPKPNETPCCGNDDAGRRGGSTGAKPNTAK